jgi:F420-dependent oxidoreductase-like protein
MTDLPKIGVFLGYWPWLDRDEQRRLAIHADRSGLDSAWVAESWGQEAASTLGWLAALTERIELGAAMMQIPARKPTTTAMAAATIDVLSDGRFRLGLGVSGPQVSEGWYGVPFAKPLARTRDYVRLVRDALEGEPVSAPLEAGGGEAPFAGRPLKLLASPRRERVPIYLGALAPRAIDQCFEIADGWMPFLIGTEMLADRPRPDRPFDISPIVPVAVSDDIEEARDAIRPWLSFYLGAMGTPRKHFLVELAERNGFGGTAREVQRLFLSGDREGAAAALSVDLIDAAGIAGRPGEVRERLAELRAAGADSVIAAVAGDRFEAVTALAACQGRLTA